MTAAAVAAALAVAFVAAGAARAGAPYAGVADQHATVSGAIGCPAGTTGAGSFTLGVPVAGSYYNDWIRVANVAADGSAFDWALTPTGLVSVDVAAIVVRGASDSEVYTYDYTAGGLDDADAGLSAPGGSDRITGVEFCFDRKAGEVGLLKVRKVVVGSPASPSAFSFTVGGFTMPFDADGENLVGLAPGTYTVTEPAVANFRTTYAGCTDVRVTDGSEAVCTITNTWIAPGPIDVAIAKTATPTTSLGAGVNYALTVRNVGTGQAIDVQVADPAPAGVAFTGVVAPTEVTCSFTASLVQCSRPGAFDPGASFVISITGTVSTTGTLTNTATVVAVGGPEADTSNNFASADTVVPAEVTPAPKPATVVKPKPVVKGVVVKKPVVKKPVVKKPVVKKPVVKKPVVKKPAPLACVALTVAQRSVTAKKPARLSLRLATSGPGEARVRITGPGINRLVAVPRSGRLTTTVTPTSAGLITLRAVKPSGCDSRRVGVVAAFEPPLTG